MEDDTVARVGSSESPSDHDMAVVHALGVGTSLAAHETREPPLGEGGSPFVESEERRFWEAHQDLLLTLLETGSRAKGVMHALAPHCLLPFKRITPEVVNGTFDATDTHRISTYPRTRNAVVNAGTVFRYRAVEHLTLTHPAQILCIAPPPTSTDIDAPRLRLLLSTTQAVLVAFHRHPARLASLLEDSDETSEVAYAFFDAAANVAVLGLERADHLKLSAEIRTELFDLCRVLCAPDDTAPDWAARTELALQATPESLAPPEVFDSCADDKKHNLATSKPVPARCELSVYVQLSRASAARAAARTYNDDSNADNDTDTERITNLLRGFDDVLPGLDNLEGSNAVKKLSPPPTLPTLRPSIVEQLAKDVTSYITESLRAHARLLDAETFRRRVAFDARRDTEKSDNSLSLTRETTRETLSILTAAALCSPPRASAAARDAAAAAIRLGRAVAEFSSDADDIEDTGSGLRLYIAASLASHANALAEVRACLATTFLGVPFRALPPLSEDVVVLKYGAIDGDMTAASKTAVPPSPLLDSYGALLRSTAEAAASVVTSPSWLAAVSAGTHLLDDLEHAAGVNNANIDPLSPKPGTMDRVLAATILATVQVTTSKQVTHRARDALAALARRAESLCRATPLASRHVSAVVTIANEVEDTLDTDAFCVCEAVSSLKRTCLGEATPFGPSLANASLAKAPRDVRLEFVRRAVAISCGTTHTVLAIAGGWLVTEMRADTNANRGNNDIASRAVFSAALATIKNAGWVCSETSDETSDETAPIGWYEDRENVSCSTRHRMSLCLLSFHGASHEGRVELLAEAAATAAGKSHKDNDSNHSLTPRSGVLAKAARAHALFIFAHCAKHFTQSPKWLERRVRDALVGVGEESGAYGTANATHAALDPCLFDSGEPEFQRGHESDAFGCVEKLSSETVLAVRDAALSLAGDQPKQPERSESFVSQVDVATACACARRAGWDALCVLPVYAHANESETCVPPVGAFTFAWACVDRCRAETRKKTTSTSSESVAALDLLVASLDAGDAMVSPIKMALTCAAVEALSQSFSAAARNASENPARALSATLRSNVSDSSRPSWLALTKLSASLAKATRRWTTATLAGQLSPQDARVVGLLLSAGIASAGAAPALDAVRPGLAREASDILGNDGRWLDRRDTALQGAASPESAARAYLDGTDVASALFACQMATRAALEATTTTARLDAMLGERAAAAAAARVLLDAIVVDPATEFVIDAAHEASEALSDAGPGSSPEVLAAARASASERRPCPAAAIATLRGDDSPLAVDAVLHAAASRAMPRPVSAHDSFFDLEDVDSSRDDTDRFVTLSAAASLLTRSDVNLSSSASISLLDVLSHAVDPKRTVKVLVDQGATESATALVRLVTHASPTTSDAAAVALRKLLGEGGEGSDSRHVLLCALLGRLPDVCQFCDTRDATRCARLLFELAFCENAADDGARAVADAFAELVTSAAMAGETSTESESPLGAFRALLHALAGFLAPPDVVDRQKQKRSDITSRRAIEVFIADTLPSVPTTSSPLRLPTRASETGSASTSVPAAASRSGRRPEMATPFSTRRRLAALHDALAVEPQSTDPHTHASVLSTSLFGDLDIALGDLGGLEGLAGDLENLAGIGMGDFRDLRNDVVADREQDTLLEQDTARAAAITNETNLSSRRGNLQLSASGAYGIGLDDNDVHDDENLFSDDEADFAEIAAAAAGDFSVSGRRFGTRSRDPRRGPRSENSGNTSLRRDLNVCTFVSSGSSFMEQHWYFCYTCDLTTSRGCCSACVRTCHRGHKVVYSRQSRFFCDCGEGNALGAPCQCLTPRAAAAAAIAADVEAESRASAVAEMAAATAAAKASAAELSQKRPPLGPTPVSYDSDSENDEHDAFELVDDAMRCDDDDEGIQSDEDIVDAVHSSKREVLRDALREAGLTSKLVGTCKRVLERLKSTSSADTGDSTEPTVKAQRLAFPVSGSVEISTSNNSSNTNLAHLRRSFKAGSFETKPKREHEAPVEIQLALASGTVTRSALSCSRHHGLLAVAEGDNVCILDAGAIAGIGGVGAVGPGDSTPPASSSIDASNAAAANRVGVRPLSRNPVSFQVARVLFNQVNDHYLVVQGFTEVLVLTLDKAGVVTDRLTVGPEVWFESSNDTFSLGAIKNVQWVPNSSSVLAVVVDDRVCVFDLSVSAITPSFTIRLDTDTSGHSNGLVDACFVRRKDSLVILLLCEDGNLYARAMQNSGTIRGNNPEDVVVKSDCVLHLPAAVKNRAGLSLHYSDTHCVGFVSFDGGATVAFRVDWDTLEINATCLLMESASESEETLVSTPVGFSMWSDTCPSTAPTLGGAFPGPIAAPLPTFVCASALAGGSSILVSLCEDSFQAQALQSADVPASALGDTETTHSISSTPQPKGIGSCGFHPSDLQCGFLFMLREDGSLQVFAQGAPPAVGVSAVETQRQQLLTASEHADARATAAKRLGTAVEDDGSNDEGDTSLPSSQLESEVSFPFDFFERATCVTGETKFGGAFGFGKTSDAIRFALQAEQGNGGVEAPRAGPSECVVSISRPGYVICGLRIHVGDGSSARIPTSVTIGPAPVATQENSESDPLRSPTSRSPLLRAATSSAPTSTNPPDARRVVSFDLGSRRWYDVPLTVRETVQAERELVFTFGAAASPTVAVRVDHIEVYAQSKAAFGWDAEVEIVARDKLESKIPADVHSDDEDADTRVSRLERLVRHTACVNSSSTISEEEHTLCCLLASLARLVAFEDSDTAKEKATKLALGVLTPKEATIVWHPTIATKRLAWRTLVACLGVEAAASLKDAETISRASEVTSHLVDTHPLRVPGPTDAEVFHRATNAVARVAFRRPLEFASSALARATTVTLSKLHEQMLEAGGGTWDPEENATQLAALVAAVAETKEGEFGDEFSVKEKSSDASHAVRLVFTSLLGGREDVRVAAADALTDALIAPKPAHQSTDYERVLRPTGFEDEPTTIVESRKNRKEKSPSFGLSSQTSRANTPTGTQFSCDMCDVSPIVGRRWHCAQCVDYDVCDGCYHREIEFGLSGEIGEGQIQTHTHPAHETNHPMIPFEDGSAIRNTSELSGVRHSEEKREALRKQCNSTKNAEITFTATSVPSAGRVALVTALANASTDDGALGLTKGITELTPFFVLLRRLCFAYETYACAMVKHAVEGAEQSLQILVSSYEVDRTGNKNQNQAEKLIAVEEKALLRLSLLSALVSIGDSSSAVSAAIKKTFGHPSRTSSFVENLKRVVEVMRERDLARGESSTFSTATESKKVWFGDWREHTRSGAFSCVPPAVSVDESLSGTPSGAEKGFGALLSADPPFFSKTQRVVADTKRSVDEFERKLFDTAVGVFSQLVTCDGMDKQSGKKSTVPPFVILGDSYREQWLTLLASAGRNKKETSSALRVSTLTIAGSKDAYKLHEDVATLDLAFTTLDQCALPDPGPWFVQRTPYSALLESCASLSTASGIAVARPGSWRKFVARRPNALESIARLACWVPETTRLDALSLLARAMPFGEKEASKLGGTARRASGFGVRASGTITVGRFRGVNEVDNKESADESSSENVATTTATNLIVGYDFSTFFFAFIASVDASDATRAAACAVARTAWRVSQKGSTTRREMARATFAALPSLAPLGERGKRAFDLAQWFVENTDDFSLDFGDVLSNSNQTGSGIIDQLAEAVTNRVGVLGTHQNAAAYAALRRALGQNHESEDVTDASTTDSPPVDATSKYRRLFVLETTPSVAACTRGGAGEHTGENNGSTSESFTTKRLDTVRVDLWHTHCAIAARLRQNTLVQKVTLSVRPIASSSRAVRVRRFSVFRAVDGSANTGQLKTCAFDASGDDVSSPLWTRIAVGTMTPSQHEATIVFPHPVEFSALAVTLDAFHVDPDMRAREQLRCPRCTRHVTDKHGVCSQCQENAHQCRRCRNINYEFLDAFLCNECGHSKYARVEVKMEARETRGVFYGEQTGSVDVYERPRLSNEDDAQRALAAMEQESVTTNRAREALRERRDALCQRLLYGAETTEKSRAASTSVLSTFARPKRPSGLSRRSVNSSIDDLRTQCEHAHDDLVASERRRHALKVSLHEYSVNRDERGSAPTSPTITSSLRGFKTSPFPFVTLPPAAEHDYACAFTFVQQVLPVCVMLVEKGLRSVADRFVEKQTLQALLDASPATLDSGISKNARRLLCETASALEPSVALKLSDTPFSRAQVLLEQLRDTSSAKRQLHRPEVSQELGDACRAVFDLCQAAQTSLLNNSSPISGHEVHVTSLRTRMFSLARLAVGVGCDRDVTMCDRLLVPTLQLFKEPSLVEPTLRDSASRETLATRPPRECNVLDVSDGSVISSGPALSVARAWREKALSRGDNSIYDDLAAMRGAGVWALRLAFSEGSPAVRSASGELLRRLAGDSDCARFALLGRLAGTFNDNKHTLLLEPNGSTGTMAYFDLLNSLLVRGSSALQSGKLDVVAVSFLKKRGFVGQLISAIAFATKTLVEVDSDSNPTLEVSPNLGTVLNRSVELLLSLLETLAGSGNDAHSGVNTSQLRDADFTEFETSGYNEIPTETETAGASSVVDLGISELLHNMDPTFLSTLFDTSIALQSLVRGRSVETSDARVALSNLVDRVAASGGVGLREAVKAATKGLRRVAGLSGTDVDVGSGVGTSDTSPSYTNTSLITSSSAGAILSSLCRLTLPPAPDENTANVSVPMRLTKSHTQEEYIRGAMTKNPYDSCAVQCETMRDVKNFICKSLDMLGLCDDDYGMELLVRGKIIALDLEVVDVYNGVWFVNSRVTHENSPKTQTPMEITYRLTGLDGDATEEIVSEIERKANEDAEEEDPEVVFGNTNYIRNNEGLEALLVLTPLLSGKQSINKAIVSIRSVNSDPGDTSLSLIRLLAGITQVRDNARALLTLDAIPTLLAEASRLFSANGNVIDAREARERGVEILLLVEKLLSEEFASSEESSVQETQAVESVSSPQPLRAGGLTRSLSGAFEKEKEMTRTWSSVVSRVSTPPPFGSFASLDKFVDDTVDRKESGSAMHTRVFLGTLGELCVSAVGERPGSTAAKRREAAAATLARVLPRLAAHDDVAASALAAHVTKTFSKLHQLDDDSTSSETLRMSLRCCALLTEGIASDESGQALKSRLLKRGAVKAVTSYLLDVAFSGNETLDKTSEQWSVAIERPALAPALTALRGLVLAHNDSACTARDAAAKDENESSDFESSGSSPALRLPPLLHALESVSTGGVGTLSENVLVAMEAADTSGATNDELSNLRQKTRESNARRAMALRERTLASMGMAMSPQKMSAQSALGASPDGAQYDTNIVSHSTTTPIGTPSTGRLGLSLGTSPGSYIAVVASPSSMRNELSLAEEEEEEEEDDACAPACQVCREGYASKPTELLGVYCFCVPVNAGGTGGLLSQSKQFSTVSHFNAIHFSCHEAAKKADAALRQPKREWEGASLRNGETKANNLLPLAASDKCLVAPDAVAAATEQWWDRLVVGAGGVAGSGSRSLLTGGSRLTAQSVDHTKRLSILLSDVGMLIGRFATQADFSRDARGGGRRSNARVLPALLLLAVQELTKDLNDEGMNVQSFGLDGESDSLSKSFETNVRRARDAKQALDALMEGGGCTSANAYGTYFPAALVLSLLVTPRATWLEARRDICFAAIAHAKRHGTKVIGAASSTTQTAELLDPQSLLDPNSEFTGDPDSPSSLFAAAKPALLFVGLIDKMHEKLQPSQRRGVAVARADAQKDNEDAEEELFEYSSIGAGTCLGVKKTLTQLGGVDADEVFEEWLEEAEDADDAMELFDVMECLGDVLAPKSGDAPASADAFMAAAFAGH